MIVCMCTWRGDLESDARVRVNKKNDKHPENVFVTIYNPGADVFMWLTHDQAWHLRDDLNKLLADGCPTTIDTDGLHADVHAAIVAVDRVAERVGLTKEVSANGG